MLLAALVAGPTAPAAASPSAAKAQIKAEAAWETPLPSRPAAPPRTLALADNEFAILLALEHSVEARRAADGGVRWSRSDLAGAGLTLAAPAPFEQGPALAWAGATPDGVVQLIVISADDGRTLRQTPLPGSPVGPPTPVPAPAGGVSQWTIPLDGGRVATASTDGAVSVAVVGPAVVPPLFGVAGKALAVLDTGDAVTVGAPSRRPAARGLVAGTVLAEGDRFYAAQSRALCAWRCKVRRTGAALCKVSWRQPLGGAVSAPPLPSGDRVLVGAWDTFVYSFDRRTGHLRWRTRAGLRLATPLLAWDDYVAAASEGAPLVQFFRRDDGAIAGKIEGQNDEIFSAGIARAGDLLVTPVLPYPSLQPLLRAYRIQISAEKK